MKYCIEQIVNYCLKNDIISENQVPWLRYGIEKRLSSIIGLISFTILAVFLSDFWCSVWFIFSFYILRKRINGYHSKTPFGCFCISLTMELLFFKFVYPILTPIIAILVSIFCIVILLLFAPYNHPNIHYSAEEILALKKSIRHRVSMLSAIFLISFTMQKSSSLQGLTLGMAMAAYMLSLAYITEWRKNK